MSLKDEFYNDYFSVLEIPYQDMATAWEKCFERAEYYKEHKLEKRYIIFYEKNMLIGLAPTFKDQIDLFFEKSLDGAEAVILACEELMNREEKNGIFVEKNFKKPKSIIVPYMDYLRVHPEKYDNMICLQDKAEFILYKNELKEDKTIKSTDENITLLILIYLDLIRWHPDEVLSLLQVEEDEKNYAWWLKKAYELSPCNAAVWLLMALKEQSEDDYFNDMMNALKYCYLKKGRYSIYGLFESMANHYLKSDEELARALYDMSLKGKEYQPIYNISFNKYKKELSDSQIRKVLTAKGIPLGFSSTADKAAHNLPMCLLSEKK